MKEGTEGGREEGEGRRKRSTPLLGGFPFQDG